MSVLVVFDIVKSFNGKKVLNNLSFELNEGETLVIVGKSGEGKSTLLKIIAGLVDADSGAIMFKGNRVKGASDRLIPGHPDIKLVNQDFALDLYHTVEENIRIKILHHPKNVIDELTEELLDVMSLTTMRNQKAHLLSGGEQQRLALARTLATEPDLILLDEPFVHLDPPTRQRIEKFIDDKRSSWNSTLIIVTHDGKEAMKWGDKIAYIHQGEFKRVGTAEDFYLRPDSMQEALFFGEMNTIEIAGSTQLFRPDRYEIVASDGVELTVFRHLFLGTHFVNFAKTKLNEDVLLYSVVPLGEHITIQLI